MYLAFAGPYPASPTSSFGHIFVLLEPQQDRPFLLWNALDFSADVTSIDPFEFFTRGLFGNLEGHYKISSFYEKLREYTLIQSRPLWIFPIKLDSLESDNFLFRFFNLQKDIHPYRFTNKNCASEIYNLIKCSIDTSYKPDNNLVLPHTIINGLKDRIEDPVFIESIYNLLKDNSRMTTLNNKDEGTLLNFLEWKYAKDNNHLTQEEISTLQNLRKNVSLSESRNYNNFKSYSKEFNIHPAMMTGGGLRINDKGIMEYLLMYRFGIHEYYENCDVYPEDDFLSLLKIELGIKKNEIQVNQFMLFNQTSLQPSTFLSNYFSWKLGLGMLRKDELPDKPLASGLFTGFGYSVSIIKNKIKLSFLMDAEPVYIKNSGLSILTGPEIITRWNISDRINWMSNLKGTLKNYADPKIYYYMENNLGLEISDKAVLQLSHKLNEYDNAFDIKLNFYIN